MWEFTRNPFSKDVETREISRSEAVISVLFQNQALGCLRCAGFWYHCPSLAFVHPSKHRKAWRLRTHTQDRIKTGNEQRK